MSHSVQGFLFAALLCPVVSTGDCRGNPGTCTVADDVTSLIQLQKMIHIGVERGENGEAASTKNATGGNVTQTPLEKAEENATQTVQAAEEVVAQAASEEKLAESKARIESYAANRAKINEDQAKADALHKTLAAMKASQRSAKYAREAEDVEKAAETVNATSARMAAAAEAAKQLDNATDQEYWRREDVVANDTSAVHDAEDATSAAIKARANKRILDKADADRAAAKEAADEAAASRQTEEEDDAKQKAAMDTARDQEKVVKSTAHDAHDAAGEAWHAEHEAARRSNPAERSAARSAALPSEESTSNASNATF